MIRVGCEAIEGLAFGYDDVGLLTFSEGCDELWRAVRFAGMLEDRCVFSWDRAMSVV